ncbi:MAG: hypothetical protein R2761_04615 [Acidimicrobiales bacterium]
MVSMVACSGGGGSAGAGSEGSPASSTAPAAAAAAGAEAPPAADGGAGGARSPEAFAEYYRKLGVTEPVVTCYVDALTELGVASLDQLEADQALGVQAADRFDRCVADADAGAADPAATTTP